MEQTFKADEYQVGEDEFGSLNAWLGGSSDNGSLALWFSGVFPRENGNIDRKQFYIEFNNQGNGRQQRRFQQYVTQIKLTPRELQIHFRPEANFQQGAVGWNPELPLTKLMVEFGFETETEEFRSFREALTAIVSQCCEYQYSL